MEVVKERKEKHTEQLHNLDHITGSGNDVSKSIVLPIPRCFTARYDLRRLSIQAVLRNHRPGWPVIAMAGRQRPSTTELSLRAILFVRPQLHKPSLSTPKPQTEEMQKYSHWASECSGMWSGPPVSSGKVGMVRSSLWESLALAGSPHYLTWILQFSGRGNDEFVAPTSKAAGKVTVRVIGMVK